MRWIMNLKIGQKVLALMLMMILFLGIVGFIGFYFNNKSIKATQTLYEENLIAINCMSNFMANSTKMIQDSLDMIMTKDVDRKTILKNEIESLKKNNNQYLKTFESMDLDSYESSKSARINELKPVFRSVLTQMNDMAIENKDNKAYDIYLKNKNLIKEYQQLMFEISEYNIKQGKMFYLQVKHDGVIANNIILLTILSAIIISGFLGFKMTVMLKRRFENLVGLANEVASGDFTSTRRIESFDEIGQTGQSLLNISKTLNKLIKEIQTSVENVSAGSQEMSASADQTAQGAQQVAVSIQQLASGTQEQSVSVNHSLDSINAMSHAIQVILENAGTTVSLSKSTENNAIEGQKQAESAVGKINQIKMTSSDISNTINELGELSSEIEQIVDLIKGIATQTNLLALNAAIEAARAGEHGKGFAVVAEEVKKLAGESATATDKITVMIKEIQNKTNTAVLSMNNAVEEVQDGVTIVENTGKSLEEILKAAKITSSQVQEISKEVNNLANNSENVVKMMENISAVTEESSASSEEISSIIEEQTASLQEINASSQTLAGLAENLNKQVAVFKV